MITASSPSFKDEMNNGPGAADNRIQDVAQNAKLGWMLAGVRGKNVTQSASTSADVIDLNTIAGTSAALKLPPMAPGGQVTIRSAGTGPTAGDTWRAAGIMSVEIPDAGLTVAGADADGGLLFTPKSDYLGRLRLCMYVPGSNEANVLGRKIRVINEGEGHPIIELFYRIPTTNGSTVVGTEIANTAAAALNADTDFSRYVTVSATGAGTSEVRGQGATVRGVKPSATDKTFGLSYYGRKLIFTSTILDAMLDYQPAASWDLALTGRFSPQAR